MTGPYDWATDPEYVADNRHRRAIGLSLLAAAVMLAWFVTRSTGPAGAGEPMPVGIGSVTVNVAGPAATVPPPVDLERSAAIVRQEMGTR